MSLKNKKILYFAVIFFCVSLGLFLYGQNTEKYTGGNLISVEDKKKEEQLEFLVTGDIMLGRFVEKLMEENGAHYPFEKIKSFLFSVPFVVSNLEGPIVLDHTPTPSFTYKFSFASTTAQILKNNNISIVSLANNHTLDQANKGYIDTARFLNESEVGYFGHPISVGNISVLRKTVEDRNLVFIGLNSTWPYDEKEYEDIIKKESLSSDFIAVFVHWGEEYKLVSNDEQKHLAHMFIDNGAHVVFGHHPHVVQEVETYKDRVIFYSLGNFIFDQYFSQDVKEGLLVKVGVENKKVSYTLFPIISPRNQPYLMTGDEKNAFLEKLALRSSKQIQQEIQDGLINLSY